MFDDITFMNANELKDYVGSLKEEEYEMIDVRQPIEYKNGHIPGARLIPIGIIESHINELNPTKELVLYCHTGRRSLLAATLLDNGQFKPKRIISLRHGLASWEGKVVVDFPKVKSFPPGKSLQEYMLMAISMEKGAMNFYQQISSEIEVPFVKQLNQLANMELTHASNIYNLYVKQEQARKVEPFEPFFAGLSGDIIEGGDELSTIFEKAREMKSCLELIEIALELEYKTYDLYKSIAIRENDADIKKIFNSLAEQEKSHTKTITECLEECVTLSVQ